MLSPEELQECLKQAADAVQGAKVPEDLRVVAFEHALDALGVGAAPPPAAVTATLAARGQEQQQPNQGTSAPNSSGSSLNTRGSAVLDQIANGLGIDGATIVRLFAEKDGEPVLIVKSSALPKTASAAACDIALMVMAARQLGGLEDYTDSEALREVVKKYGKFNSANFAASLKSLDNLILTEGKGSGVKRKLTMPGIEAATDLLEKYAGEA
jgi:hypothetical protein